MNEHLMHLGTTAPQAARERTAALRHRAPRRPRPGRTERSPRRPRPDLG